MQLLEKARGEYYPSLGKATDLILKEGVEQITMHLREDRRHIQDEDIPIIRAVTKKYERLLNLEIGASKEMIHIAYQNLPDWVCFVPEKREERTTEGGLDLTDKTNCEKIKKACRMLKDKDSGINISLFVEAKEEIISHAVEMDIDAVEIHTGDYAGLHMAKNNLRVESALDEFKKMQSVIKSYNLGFHGGHGLTKENLPLLCRNKIFEEYNIGHSIICDSIFEGLQKSVQKIQAIILGKEI